MKYTIYNNKKNYDMPLQGAWVISAGKLPVIPSVVETSLDKTEITNTQDGEIMIDNSIISDKPSSNLLNQTSNNDQTTVQPTKKRTPLKVFRPLSTSSKKIKPCSKPPGNSKTEDDKKVNLNKTLSNTRIAPANNKKGVKNLNTTLPHQETWKRKASARVL